MSGFVLGLPPAFRDFKVLLMLACSLMELVERMNALLELIPVHNLDDQRH